MNALRCNVCDAPAVCSTSNDPFGKSSATKNWCEKHAPDPMRYRVTDFSLERPMTDPRDKLIEQMAEALKKSLHGINCNIRFELMAECSCGRVKALAAYEAWKAGQSKTPDIVAVARNGEKWLTDQLPGHNTRDAGPSAFGGRKTDRSREE